MYRLAIHIALVALLTGCDAPLEDGTARMAARLDSIAAANEAAPRGNAHVNKARVRSLLAVEPPADPRQRIAYLNMLGQEQLRAGYNEDAIATFAEIRAVLDTLPGAPPGYRLAVEDALGISYLRLGEAENCIVNHTVDRCLLPIRAAGVHSLPRGSEGAIRHYTAILREDPGDLTARWLLNIAYMTLGRYPGDVPEAWRIPPEALASEHPFPRFGDRAPALGVDVVGLSGGAVMEDLNGDGYLDLLASSWGLRDTLRYFESGGDGTFADRTAEAGLHGLTGGLNLIHADYDNDGDADVLVLRGAWLGQGHPNSLLRNDGGRFVDVTEAAGLLSFHPAQTAAWADVDLDGDLDLFIGNETTREGGVHPSELYLNDGDGTFTEAAAARGLDVRAYVKAAVWGDVDNDLDPDLFLSVYQGPNRLYRNDDGTFVDVAAEAGVQEPIDSFPAWFWDYDNDGWQDLFVSGWRATAADVAAEYLGAPRQDEPPRLYRNRGDGTFEDVTAQARLDRVLYTMGSNVDDLDGDGWQDFYAGTGDPNFRALMPNRLFRNDAGRAFQDVSADAGMGHLQKGHGVAVGDLDGDGDQDVYTVMGGAFEGDVFANALFENPGFGHAWLTLRLEGVTENRSALGARLRVEVEDADGTTRTIHRAVTTGGSFGSSSLQQEIGLGEAAAVRTVEVTWPASGTTQRFTDVAMGRAYRVQEGADVLELLPRRPFALVRSTPASHSVH